MKKTLTTSLLLAASILPFYSCQEYSPFSLEEMTKAEFSKNFFDEYGQFPADMNWDLSSQARTAKIDPSVFDIGSQTRAIECPVATNLDGVATKLETYYQVQPATLTWLRNNLAEGRNNTTKGNAFRLTQENTQSFAIIPIYQGTASMVWDLHLVSGGNDYKIWSKNEGLELKHGYTSDVVNITADSDTDQKNRIVAALCSGYWSFSSAAGSLINGGPAGDEPYVQWYSSGENEKSGDGLYDTKITFREADNAYKYIPGSADKGIYLNESVTVNDWSGSGEHNATVNETKSSTWSVEKEGGKWYLKLDKDNNPYFPYIAHDYMWDNPYYEIVSMKKNELVLRAAFNRNYKNAEAAENPIVWQFTLKHDDDYANLGLDSKSNTMETNDLVRAHPIVISGISGDFYMYLHITNGDTERGYAPDNTHQRSDAGMMLAMTCDAPTNLQSSAEAGVFGESFKSQSISKVMVIGCEDSHMWGSDWDLNDVVFLMVGLPELPHKKELIGKRYMMEDLGNTFDFDFNDIVVDVSEIDELQMTSPGVWTQVDNEHVVQVANIRYKCGTLPFQVGFNKTGNTAEDKLFARLNGEINVVPAVVEGQTQITSAPGVKFWDKDENNIFVRVWQNGNTETGPDEQGVFTATFPAAYRDGSGEEHKAPQIIAVPQSVVWMNEGVHIPSEWWSEGQYSNDNLDIIWRPADNYFAQTSSTTKYNTSGVTISVDGHDVNTVIDPVTDQDFLGSVTVQYQSLNGWNHCVITLNNNGAITAGKYDFKCKINSLHDLNEVSVKFNGGNEPRFYDKVKAGQDATLKATVEMSAAESLTIEFFFHKDVLDNGKITISDVFFQPHQDK